MSAVVYSPASVLHWFDTDSRRSRSEGVAKTKDLAKTTDEEGFLPGLKQAAGAVMSFGKGAVGNIVQKQAEETRYELHSSGFEAVDLTRHVRIDYKEVEQITSYANDRFVIVHGGGKLTIKPVAHLVSGRLRAAIGWERNGVEVPYAMLLEELAARSGVDIVAE